MKNKTLSNHSALFKLIALILIFFYKSATGQDFILTKSNELIACDIAIDSPEFILYRKDSKIINLQKSFIADYTISSERKRDATMEITDNQGVRLSGRLLFADRDSLYFWRGSKVYHPHKGSFLAISTDQVNQIIIYRKGNFNKGFGTGMIVGFSMGVFGGYISDDPSLIIPASIGTGTTLGLLGGIIGSMIPQRIQLEEPKNEIATKLELIQRNAMLKAPPIKAIGRDTLQSNWISHDKSFYKSPRTQNAKTKLLQPSTAQAIAPTTTFVHNVNQGNQVTSLDSLKRNPKSDGQTKVSIQIFGGFQLLSAQRNDIYSSINQSNQGGSVSGYSLFGRYTVTYPRKLNSAAFRDFSIELALKKSHRLSLMYTGTTSFGAEGITGITEVGKKSAFEFYYLYVPKPYIPNKTSKWVSSFGIAPSINFLETEVARYGNSITYGEKYKPGISSQLTCSYFALPNFSIGIRALGRLVPGLTIPESPELREHKLNFSSLDFAFGIGVHF